VLATHGTAGVLPATMRARLPSPLGRIRPGRAGWAAAAILAAAAVLLPVAMLARLALGGGPDLWPHLIRHVVPVALGQTALMLLGVGAIVVAIGTGAAWLVTAYEFRGRRVLDWALLLPLAVPTYLVAYAYSDLLHPVGPVQTALRTVLGLKRPSDLPLPEIRSLGGAILLLGVVLYPYVYLTTRALFLMQSASVIEIARTLGVTRNRVFSRVALPLARPAIAVGASLALLEALNDIGAAAFLGIQPLTVAIYSTWINQSDLAGAAQIALVMLALVTLLVGAERWARRRQGYAFAAQRARPLARIKLAGGAAALALAAGVLPVLLGFAAPVAYLAVEAGKRIAFAGVPIRIVQETVTTLALAGAATALAVAIGLVVAFAGRLAGGRGHTVSRIASLGYAVPGAVLALGLLPMQGWLATRLGGTAAGGIALASAGLVYAYGVRFLAIPIGGIEAGFGRLPLSLDYAAATLGRRPLAMLAHVHLPLSLPAIAAAAILVFVDCMKELPITLMLRPLNVETLATHLYGEAIRGTYEDGALAALLIVLVGLAPVVLLSRVSGRLGRPN
jgi:iron(III) transport system permease protein